MKRIIIVIFILFPIFICCSQSFVNIESYEIYGIFNNYNETAPPYTYSEEEIFESISKAVPLTNLGTSNIYFLPQPLIGRMKIDGIYYIFLYYEGGIIKMIDSEQPSNTKYYYDKELCEDTFGDW